MTIKSSVYHLKPAGSILCSGLRKWTAPAALVVIFILLIFLTVPDGHIFGSHLDWMSQHAALAETIRDACLDQGTLLPSWLELGGGSNGFMFSYYGYLRPDILIGCLLPRIPMINILMAYMLCIYLASVLLCYWFLRAENAAVPYAFAGSVLFMTAGCMFHMHRQIMFVSYLPFLLLSFLCIRKRRTKWLPLCLCLIWLHSFYYIIGVLAAVGWYWLRTEGRDFRKKYFLKGFVSSTLLSVGMAAALLIPTGLVILEHRRGGSFPSLLELFGPNVAFNNLLFNEYGMGLSFICLYAVLAGLKRKNLQPDSILFLLFGLFGIFSYLLNGTLYARPKILIPFMPLIVLHCVRFFQEGLAPVQDVSRRKLPAPERTVSLENPFSRWPFAIMIPVGLLWFSQAQYPFILLELCLLLCFCLLQKGGFFTAGKKPLLRAVSGALALLLTMTAPVGLCLVTAQTEEWVSASEVTAGLSEKEASSLKPDSRYRFDSLVSPLESSNELIRTGQPRSSMYSSITNRAYSEFYYDTLLTPVRINNRVALLTSDNPFMLNLMGVRYLETPRDQVPAGYEIIQDSGSPETHESGAGDTVIAENRNVLPIVYFTDQIIPESEYGTLGTYEKLDALTRFTVAGDGSRTLGSRAESSAGAGAVGESGTDRSAASFQTLMETWNPELILPGLPDGLTVTETSGGWEITSSRECTFTAEIRDPAPGRIVLLQFNVESLTAKSVVIDINGIRNKLSNRYAPYPNGNNCFHYQFSPSRETDVETLEITLPEGRYILSNFEWRLYRQELLSEKSYTPLETSAEAGLSPDSVSEDGAARSSQDSKAASFAPVTVQAGTIRAETDGCIATSIPLQKGLEILVDGKPAELTTVNGAFAGTFIGEGTHRVEIRFHPPGNTAGCILSILSLCGYVLFLICTGIRMIERKKD